MWISCTLFWQREGLGLGTRWKWKEGRGGDQQEKEGGWRKNWNPTVSELLPLQKPAEFFSSQFWLLITNGRVWFAPGVRALLLGWEFKYHTQRKRCCFCFKKKMCLIIAFWSNLVGKHFLFLVVIGWDLGIVSVWGWKAGLEDGLVLWSYKCSKASSRMQIATSSPYMRQKMMELKDELDKSTIRGLISTPFLIIDKIISQQN